MCGDYFGNLTRGWESNGYWFAKIKTPLDSTSAKRADIESQGVFVVKNSPTASKNALLWGDLVSFGSTWRGRHQQWGVLFTLQGKLWLCLLLFSETLRETYSELMSSFSFSVSNIQNSLFWDGSHVLKPSNDISASWLYIYPSRESARKFTSKKCGLIAVSMRSANQTVEG